MRRLLSFILLCQRVFHHRTHATNATFFRAATKQRNATDQRPWKWHWLPGYQRLGWKLLIVFGPGILVYWWFQLSHDAAAILVVFLFLLIGNLVVAAFHERRKGRKHTRHVVEPLQAAVEHVLKETA